MSTRRVRTARGESRYDKPIGALISRGRRIGSVERMVSSGGVRRVVAQADTEDFPLRAKPSDSAADYRTRRAKIKAIDAQRSAALRGERVPIGSPVLYHSPKKVAEARRSGNPHAVKSRAEALGSVRGRVKGVRDVGFNRTTGKFVVLKGADTLPREDRFDQQGYGIAGRRPRLTGSAVRAKVRRMPAQPAYAGKRRRD